MKLALNGATTMRATLEEDIRVASTAGFDYLEIWAAKLKKFFNYGGTTTDLRAQMNETGLKPYSINSIEHVTFRDEPGRNKITNECDELCRIASELDCPYIVIVPSPLPPGRSQQQVIDESCAVLTDLGSIADRYGVSLAFEFLGQPDCSVPRLDLAHEIVGTVARPNVGLVLDSFHFYAGGSTIESIEALDQKELFIFHINDAEDLPREKLQDSHRLLPGLGILPLAQIIDALRKIGYDRVASVEIFRPEYWQLDPLELAVKARAAVANVLAR